jgi:hypothetical protein
VIALRYSPKITQLAAISVISSCLLTNLSHADAPSLERLFATSCFNCHQGESAEGNIDLEAFRPVIERHISASDFATSSSAQPESPDQPAIPDLQILQSDFRRIDLLLEVLEQQSMPPDDAESIGVDEREAAIVELEKLRSNLVNSAPLPDVPLRRMNRFQYSNAVQDLFELKVEVFSLPEKMARAYGYYDPASGKMPEKLKVGSRPLGKSQLIAPRLEGVAPFPQDLRAEFGFDNRADHLSLSPLLMESLLRLSRSIVHSRDFGPKTVGVWKQLFAEPMDWKEIRDEEASVLAEIMPRVEFLLKRAFRRSPTLDEVERYGQLAAGQVSSGASFANAIKSVASAVLASPKFLYFYEQGIQPELALASRLSLFLWGSIPDERLLELAESRELSKPEVLKSEVRRMIDDKKSKRFCDGFPTQWLQLERIITSIPDRELFPDFYFVRFRKSMHMMLEPLLLFETILVENRPVMELIHSDFSYRSEMLEDWYAHKPRQKHIPPTQIPFRRVKIDDRRQGGVITCAATMTMTSGPRATKPITRGAWFLATILNNPPEPPPADVPPLPEDHADIDKLSIRERLAKHRDSTACRGCHRRLDPLGFALENFDAVGRWRDFDEQNLPIDASGILFGVHPFSDVTEIKTILLKRPEIFQQAFTKHLLSYAIARETTPADFRSIDQIAALAAEDELGLRDLIILITQSESFLGNQLQEPATKSFTSNKP